MTKMTRRMMGASALAVIFAASFAAAQAPQITRGTIDKIDGPTITLKQASGPDVNVKLARQRQGVRA